jgi:hypothetical protein
MVNPKQVQGSMAPRNMTKQNLESDNRWADLNTADPNSEILYTESHKTVNHNMTLLSLECLKEVL